MIFCPNDNCSYYVHYSAVKKDGFKMLDKKSPVEFSLYENLYMKQVDSVWPLYFNHDIASEHKLTRLMNQCFDIGDLYIDDLAKKYYEGF